TIPFWHSLPVVGIAAWVPLHSWSLTLPLRKDSKRACVSTRSSKVKICSRTIKRSSCASWVGSRLQPWSRRTPVSRPPWAFHSGAQALCSGPSQAEERQKARQGQEFHARPAPNHALHLTASSVRSCLASASGRR